MQKIPEAQMLFETASKPIAPSVIAEIPPQSPLSKEAAERMLAFWAESQDDGDMDEKKSVPAAKEFDHEVGFKQDFEADSQLSAADYLAPDDAAKAGFKGDKRME